MTALTESRLLRIGGLASGFAIGQGSMFVAQSWLVASNHTAPLGEIGLGLAILSLAQWTADWGGTLLLARHAATDDSSGYIRGAIVCRLCLTPIILAATFLFVLRYTDAPLVRGLILGGCASIVLWAVNLTGYLDGKGKNALSGSVSGLSWFAASLGLLGAAHGTFAAGLLVGLCYSAGVLATVVIQYAIALHYGMGVGFTAPTKADIRRFAKEGTLICSADLPAQIYGRLIIMMVAAYVGAEATGVYVYIRQIVVGATQAINFLIRVEFPYVVRYILEGSARIIGIVRLQRWSIGSSVLIFVVTALSAILLRDFAPPSFQKIVQLLPYFSLLIPAGTVSLIFGQSVVANDAVKRYSIVMLCTIAGSLTFMCLTMGKMGVPSIFVSEILMYSVQTLSYGAILKAALASSHNNPGTSKKSHAKSDSLSTLVAEQA